MFSGEFVQKLDEKNRVILPKQLRHPLSGEDLDKGFCLTRGFEGALLLLHREEWDVVADQVQALHPMRGVERTFQRLFFAKAVPVRLDGQFRFLIPDSHRRLAVIEKEVVFVGVGRGVEIWSRDLYEKYENEMAGSYGDLAERVFFGEQDELAGGGGGSPLVEGSDL